MFLFCQDKEYGCQWPIDGQIMKGVSQTKDKRDKRIRTKDKDIRVAPIKERKVKVSVAGNGPLIINICHTTDKGIELILMYIYDKTSPQAKRHKPSLLFTSLTSLTFITR